MTGKIFGRIGMLGSLGLGLALTACNGRDDAPPMGDMGGEMPMERDGMGGMQDMGGMPMDQGMMQGHARDLDELTPRLRRHVEEMRQLPAEQQHQRMGEHVAEVSQMLNLMNRQMREMDMGMGMSDEQMGQMMGMTGEEHRQMIEQMQAIRTEVEQLQTATLPEVRDRMPEHLDRLEEMVRMMEQSAEHMRQM